MYFSVLPEQFFSQVLALWVMMQKIFFGPIVLVGDFSICSDHDGQATRSENESFDFVLKAGFNDVSGSFNRRFYQFIFIFWNSRWNWRGHMNDAFDIFQSRVPRQWIKQVSFSEFKVLLGMWEVIQKTIFDLIGKTSDSSNNLVAPLEKLSDNV